MFAGTAVHRAVANILEDIYPGRFAAYKASWGIDFTDTWTGDQVELGAAGSDAIKALKYPGQSIVTYDWSPWLGH